MGEVYRARDTRLGRDVAVKILPREFAGDPDRLRRFEAEARSASVLNHPNIVAIHDVGEAEAGPYVAMELVLGSTLRELLLDGPLPVRRLLQIGGQVADGLSRAHAAGVVHRDLKPENIMVGKDGFPKILDFGLAKLVEPEPVDLSAAETAALGTQPGSVVGTAGYMSPEQAAGKPVDFRSDQFSLGSILYEMATGQRAFRKETTAETLAAILREEPEPLGSASPGCPAPLRWIIERCLAKDPEERYASTRDLARDLATLRDRLSDSGVALTAGPGMPRVRRAMPWMLLTATLLALGAVLLLPRARRDAVDKRLLHFSVAIPPGTAFHSSEITTNSAISPDGRRLAVRVWQRGGASLCVATLDTFGSKALAGTEDADSPFWSPDGRFLGFFSGGKLKKISPENGPPIALCDTLHEGPGSWGRDGTILFAEIGSAPGIFAVSADGQGRRRVTAPGKAHPREVHLWPHFLPDGRRFLYLAIMPGPEDTGHEVRLGELGSERTQVVAPIDSRVEFAPPGWLLFVREGSLLAQPFDATTGLLSGEASSLVDRLHYFYGPGNAGFSVSRAGTLAYEVGRRPSRLSWYDRGGREVSTIALERDVGAVRLSPDGKILAADTMDRRTGTSDIWIYELERNVPTRLTAAPTEDDLPVWSPDGRRIVFRSDRRGPPDIYEVGAGSPGGEKPVLELAGVQRPEDWSSDGRFLAYSESSRKTGQDIWLLPLEGDRKPAAFLQTRFHEGEPRFSPDGRWLAYASDESGGNEIYVALRDEATRRVRISTGGGRSPCWRRDGREVFYLAPDNRLMAVTVRLGANAEASAPVSLFRFESGVFDYDVSASGDRFIASTPIVATGDSPIRVLVGWPLRARKELPGSSGVR
jgi:serine/threonine protein kinase/Tol biopolymer transport system component